MNKEEKLSYKNKKDIIKELIYFEKKKFIKNPTILNFKKMEKNIDELKKIKWNIQFIEKYTYLIKNEINQYEIIKGLINND